jgi:hypothetical protein
VKDVAVAATQYLGRKSSRRGFFRFVGASSLGVGLSLTGSQVSLGEVLTCSGCGGGPCNPCFSPHPQCGNIGEACKTCADGGGCKNNCTTTGEWFCCNADCLHRCSECSCPSGCCHCFKKTFWGCDKGVQCPCP